MKDLLVTEKVFKKFGDFTALNGVSISVPKNSIFGLLGPNGAGKTTLIRIINQITMPDQGMVYLDGNKLKPDDIQHIGYMPEERGLYKNMKVGEQAIYLAMLKGMTKTDARASLKYWFDKFDIGSWWQKKMQELSKGQAQKVQFIITVMHKPKLLIFDEVFSGLDPINANLIRDEILQLRDEGSTVIFSTHRMESVEELCDHIALLDHSNKILEGNLVDIKKEFKTNTYEVGLHTDHKEQIRNEIKERFTIENASFKSLDDDLKLHINLPENENSSDLIQYLSTKASINHFVEIIPTASDIFIQAVKQNS
jgi:ABC-2 type transport system ATP-binding protein